jgi:hypothetical protein
MWEMCRRLVVGASLVGLTAAAASGQPARAQRPAVPNEAADPAEVNRLFDAYAIVQAQEMLQLDDALFGSFVTRLRALQDARRRHLRGRAQIIQDLQRLVRQGEADEAVLRERMEALARQDAAGAADTRRAAEAVDEVLDVRQRARFRVFEHQLEIKKLELLARVRQQIRANRAQRAAERP